MLSWHNQDRDEVLKDLKVELDKGLNDREAERRRELVGLNQIKEQEKKSSLTIFINQFKDFMVIVLLSATLISFFLGELADAITIIAIVIINSFLGFLQEYRAEKSMEALKKLVAPEAMVKRNGLQKKISAYQLVPGDIVVLNTGDIIPADLRLLEISQLEIEESALTGESLPVKKKVEALKEFNIALGDRKNMAYMGTIITRGKGLGVVVATGMDTEMGQIAGLMQKVENEITPLQRRLEQLGKWLVFFCLFIVILVVFTGIWRGGDKYSMVLTGVSLAVAAIPEGLPAIVTIVLAVGVQKMIRKNAIVRKLPAVETLGCATIICSDKTGTLTQNQMTVRKLFIGEEIEVTGEGYDPKGEIKTKNKKALVLLAEIAALCNNSILQKNNNPVGGFFRKNDKQWSILGDPTEGALLVLAAKAGIWREKIEKQKKRLYEIPFDSNRKCMSVIYEGDNCLNVYTKGAPDIILEKCSHILWQDKVIPLSEEIKNKLLKYNEDMASDALRVLGLAYRELSINFSYDRREDQVEENLIFVGLTGMIDPPRSSALKAVEKCKRAGIKTIMITGDHRITAQAVAKELKIHEEGNIVFTGAELDQISDKELKKLINKVSVFARVTPKHKLRIVKLLKEKGHIVAMTGDGVNDAPAVKEADIGISMGISGTDVTKESSAMILSDDNFATIVAAIEEGRGIYDNIRKFIRYLLSCNVGEVLTMFFATLFGLPLPLLPIQILWVNLVTDGLPAMALGVDPAEPDIMHRRPRHPKESIFARGLGRRIAIRGSLICLGTLLVFIVGFYINNHNLTIARTMAFSALVFSQLFHVFDCRSERFSIFEIGIFSNPYLVGAVCLSVIMQLLVIYLPFLQPIFKTQALGMIDWLVILFVSGGTTILQGFYRSLKRFYLKKLVYMKV